MHNFKNLKIWQESMALVLKVYSHTKDFPDYEKFGLTSQVQRCAVSIPSNIAEGSSKSSNKHFLQYLDASLGSAFELETQLILASNLDYIDSENFKKLEKQINQIQKMISGFQARLK